MMVFMSKTCLYVSSISKPWIHEKKFLDFFKIADFFLITYFFLAKQRFCKYQLSLNWPISELAAQNYGCQSALPVDFFHFFAQISCAIFFENKVEENSLMKRFKVWGAIAFKREQTLCKKVAYILSERTSRSSLLQAFSRKGAVLQACY